MDGQAIVLERGDVVIEALRRTIDCARGRKSSRSVTVPVLDGPFKPNSLLDSASLIASVADADNLVTAPDGFRVSSGRRVLALSAAGVASEVVECDAPVTALALGPNGRLAIGLDGVGLALKDASGMQLIQSLAGRRLNCVTALDWTNDDRLIVANGSTRLPAAEWRRDLMSRGSTGFVAVANGRLESRIVADGLAFPAGLCASGTTIHVTEAWRHQILSIGSGLRAPVAVLKHLPGYPARIIRLSAERFGLCFYSVRSQLIEFVLRETRFRRRMLEEVPEPFWVAPALSSGHSFKEPLQAGGVIRLGIHKPWAPTRSYGLVCILDANLQPLASAHSRAGGRRHGVVSIAERDGVVYAAAKGNGEIVALNAMPCRHGRIPEAA